MAELHPDNPYVEQRLPDPSKAVEFSPEQLEKHREILARYPNERAALLPTLHLAQETWGWLSPEVIVYVADLLDLSPAVVFGVISFYNMYNQKPVGKHHLQVCTNLSCMLRGAYDIYDHLCTKLGLEPGQNSDDGRFRVIDVECLGSCGTAPVVQLNNDYHEEMSIEKIDALLEKLD